MKQMKPFTVKRVGFVMQLTREQANLLGITAKQEEAGEEIRGIVKCIGPWQLIKTYSAICCKYNSESESDRVIYGPRTLNNLVEIGHELEGKVSIGGKRVRGFTSSTLMQIDDGPLFNVAIIYI